MTEHSNDRPPPTVFPAQASQHRTDARVFVAFDASNLHYDSSGKRCYAR
jgi:hypothetical protein